MRLLTGALTWGMWSVGDLADIAGRVAELLGASAPIESLLIEKPEVDDLPHVLVAVSDENEVAELREAVQNTEYVVDFFGRRTPYLWQAEVAGLRLAVETEGQTYE